jgi:WhiB family redox-sensing transcriptional regulator
MPSPSQSSDQWRQKAACLHADPDLFFPSSDSNAHAALLRAKAICRMCPVISRCLQWAVTNNETQGIWGGLTPQERKSVRRKLIRAGRRHIERLEDVSLPWPTATSTGFRHTQPNSTTRAK